MVAVSAASKYTVLAATSVALVAALALAGSAVGVQGGKRDKEPPSAPTNLRLSAATPFSVSLAWDAAEDNVGITGYYVNVDARRTSTAGTTHTVERLECGQSVYVRVTAFDAVRNRSAAATATVSTAACPDFQAPTTPSGFRQLATTQDAVVVAWDPSTDNMGVVGYGVYRHALPVQDTSESSVALSGLSCDSAYEYTVDAVDAAGNRSTRGWWWVQTAACSDGQPPTAPTGLAVTAHTADSLSLAWSPSTDNVGVAGYRISLGSASVMTVTEAQATLSNLPCGVSYTVSVDAFDAAGNRSAAANVTAATDACGSPPAPPSPSGDTTAPSMPTGLAVASVSGTSVALTWSPSTDDVGVAGYGVYVNGTSTSTTTQTGKTVSSLSCGTAYTFEVDAYDAAGNRSSRAAVGASTSACALAGDTTPPTTPPNVAVSAASATSISLTWTASTDNVGVAGYGVYVNGSGPSSTARTSKTVSSLTCGTAYSFEVDAFDAAGNRSTRAPVMASTSPCPDTESPTAPTNVIASSRTATSIALSWIASTDNVAVSGYGLYRGGSQVGTSSSTTGIFSGLTCNTNYTLAVDAYDAAGNRSSKTTVMVATTACLDTTPPSTPTGLSTSNVTQTGMTLSWTVSADNVAVAGYDLYVNGSKTGSATTTSYSFTSLACGTSYTLGVVAYDAAGNRSSQASAAASTSACSAPQTSPGQIIWSADAYAPGDFSEWSGTQKLFADRAAVVDPPAEVKGGPRSRSKIGRFRIQSGDVWSDGANRAEAVQFNDGSFSGHNCQGSDIWVAWESYFGDPAVVSDANAFRPTPDLTWNTIQQWHHGGPSSPPWQLAINTKGGASPSSWFFAIYTRGGPSDSSPTPTVTHNLGTFSYGWHEFRYYVKWGQADGRLKVWTDGVAVVDYTGPIGFSSDGPCNYFKQGYYRFASANNSTVFHAGTRMGTTEQAVMP